MDITENIEIHDCPICGGPGLIEEEDMADYKSEEGFLSSLKVTK